MSILPIFIAGRFAVHKLVHARGMGDVYVGRDSQNGRRVAVKIFAPRWVRHEQSRELFFAEVRRASGIEHVALARALEVESLPGGRCYVAAPWIAGEDLSEVLPPTPMDPRDVTALLAPVASALDALHAAGIVHRTLNDTKIRLTPELACPVVLTGVGAAPLLAGGRRPNSAVTSPSAVDFVAPEMDGESEPDRRADIYALGVLAFRLLTGQLPFPTRESVEHALLDRQSEDPPTLSVIGPASFSPALETAVACALVSDPRIRYASAGMFIDAMRAALDAPLAVPHEETDAVVRKLLKLGPRRAERELDTLDSVPPMVVKHARARNLDPTPIQIRRVLTATLGWNEATMWGAVAALVTLGVMALAMLSSLAR